MVSKDVQAFRRRTGWRSSVVSLIVVDSLVLVYELVRINNPDRLRLQLLGVPTSAALLAAGVLFVSYQGQVARASAPLIRYVSRWVSTPERSLRSADARYWQVWVGNMGNGTAICEGFYWLLATRSSVPASLLSIEEVHESLNSCGLTDAQDYWIANYSRGMGLGPAEERCYFECAEAGLALIESFEVVLVYRSLLGDAFEKRISLVPHPGASEVVRSVPTTGLVAP